MNKAAQQLKSYFQKYDKISEVNRELTSIQRKTFISNKYLHGLKIMAATTFKFKCILSNWQCANSFVAPRLICNGFKLPQQWKW